jgi:glycosyltransferase involved in cell wall biosynthesis
MKIPHALASGTAVITTPVGAEGIAINSENGLWVCNSKRSMVAKINEVLGQDALLKARGEAGKAAVRSLFSESMIIAKFEALYKQLIHT